MIKDFALNSNRGKFSIVRSDFWRKVCNCTIVEYGLSAVVYYLLGKYLGTFVHGTQRRPVLTGET
jgi:hypothetical protein